MASQNGSAHETHPPAADLPGAWDGAVRSALSARKNGATPSEIARVAKTLARLGAAATAATDSAGAPGATGQAAPESFEDVLGQLAHG